MNDTSLIKTENIKKYFEYSNSIGKKKNFLKAVDDVSMDINRQEIVGLVGESGCGKTTLGRLLVGLYDVTSGSIYYENTKLDNLKNKQKEAIYKKMNIVFQDPFTSLDPKWNIFRIIQEPKGKKVKTNKIEDEIVELLEKVGISSDALHKYPHEFSGGQRQRIAIARSLITNPSFLILDEPTSSLDVSVQAQILNLLLKLRAEFHTTYLFISHDLGVVKYVSDRIIVMYLGNIVEIASKNELFENTAHPYTKILLEAVPRMETSFNHEGKNKVKTPFLEESAATIDDDRCIFFDRCPDRFKECQEMKPKLYKLSKTHQVRCFKYKT